MRKIILFLLAAMLLGACCKEQPDLDAYKKEILELHRGFISAHLAKDVESIAEPTADGYLFVAGGEVEISNAGKVAEWLERYFARTEFTEYSDVADPIIGISDDGSLAWSIVQVRVAGTSRGEDGTEEPFDTLWAWITLYKREGEGWLRISDVSTYRPYESGEQEGL